MPRMGARVTRPKKTITCDGRTTTITLAPATIAAVGIWRTDVIAQMVQAFSAANGGPAVFEDALAYWSADERLVSVSTVVEVAVWWSIGTGAIAVPQKERK